MSKVTVTKNEDSTYQVGLQETSHGFSIRFTRDELEQTLDAITQQLNQELNDDLANLLDDDSCEGCKI